MNPESDAAPRWRVICLCAQWCGVCREWQVIFQAESALHPQLEFAWIDVEDEADAMGDVDIETFPTLMIARDDEPLFFGPVQPSGAQFSRLLSSLLETGSASGPVSPEAGPLMQCLGAVLLAKR
ncbi:co-chaperone YbbN [Caenimonas sp. SL110]|uniref:thioredoxin family protein n=1 Tax=Caenimonas sp. SL110 TaxID=1450524 RepID=UPI0006533A0F|nr:thioredoxin family protein [Caenimonas sp. SL110]